MIKVSSSSQSKNQHELSRKPDRWSCGSLAIRRSRAVTASVSSTVPNGSMLAEVKRDEKPIIVIDNYDSFTYNPCQRFRHFTPDCSGPRDNNTHFWRLYGFAVHRRSFGGNIVHAPTGVVHGKSSLMYYDEKLEPSLFQGLSKHFHDGRAAKGELQYCAGEQDDMTANWQGRWGSRLIAGTVYYNRRQCSDSFLLY